MTHDAQPMDFTGSGWSFPLGVNSTGGISLSRGERDIAEAMRMILSTPLGERRMRPNFGCGVHDLTFATNDATTHGLIRQYVMEAVALWEPRVQIVDVRINVDRAEPAKVVTDVVYEIRATNERRNLVYPFYLIPQEKEGE